jgi:asparagine synthase (glutamine-hydrolysing)
MDFVIDLPIDTFAARFTAPADGASNPSFIRFAPGKPALEMRRYCLGTAHFYLLGDCVLPESNADDIATFLAQRRLAGAIHELKGFFYLIYIDYQARQLEIHSSFLNILPLYYSHDAKRLLVASSLGLLVDMLKERPRISQGYVVEKLLFNYAFLNRTPFEGIGLAPSLCFVRINQKGISFPQSFVISDLYVPRPQQWRSRLQYLSDIFIAEMAPMIPRSPFALTLTGGFDGRTILSVAEHLQASFSTFSYGLAKDPDVRVPAAIGRRRGFEHQHFDLGQNYAREAFWEDGMAFLRQTDGAGNISRAHYVHTAKNLAADFPFLVSGNFGSELIRAMKHPGVMASPALFALFSISGQKEFFAFIEQYPALRFIEREKYAAAIEETAATAWTYKENLPRELTVNQQFYLYMFGEVFRKYFGPEIISQYHYLRHRAPFLSFSLLKALLDTTLAGANSQFREKNPFRRFHGQVLYAHILKKTSPELLDIQLDRGYAPRDFLTLLGPGKIAWGYFRRNILSRIEKQIPSYAAEYYQLNHDKLTAAEKNLRVLHPPTWRQTIASPVWGAQLHDVVNALSMELHYQENT